MALSSNEDDGDGFSPVHTGNTYTPDFLVELAAEGRRYYYIIDSKNSSFNSVKRFQVPSVVFKYMFSIAPLSDNDSAEAIVLLCGKEKTSGPESLFGIARDLRRPVKTDFLLIPLPGSTDENVYSLRDILRKACKRIS